MIITASPRVKYSHAAAVAEG